MCKCIIYKKYQSIDRILYSEVNSGVILVSIWAQHSLSILPQCCSVNIYQYATHIEIHCGPNMNKDYIPHIQTLFSPHSELYYATDHSLINMRKFIMKVLYEL